MNLLYSNDRRGEYPQSLYAETRIPLDPYPQLKGETRADVAVIGGGYTGLSAALSLAQMGHDVALVEAHRVGFGASGRNGGQVGSGQRQEIDWMEKHLGRDDAKLLWSLGEDAKQLVRDLAAAAGVPFHPGIAHACRTKAEVDHAAQIAQRLARDYDYDAVEALDHDAFRAIVPSDAYIGGDLDMGAGHLHPLNLAIGLARMAVSDGARLFEMSHVHRIEHAKTAGQKTVVFCDTGRIVCDHVILAGNGYLGSIDDTVARHVMPINNFIVATEPLGARVKDVLTRNIAVADTKFVVNYWRLSDDGRLIFGGGENLGYKFPRDIRAKVRPHLLSIYPSLNDVALTHAWGGTLAITMNRMPYLARPAPNALAAGGYSGHGVALATLAGRMMAEAVNGQSTGFEAMEKIVIPRFPGGGALRAPLLALGMGWYSLRDRLGF